jgi:VCBS repeat protein
MWTAPMPGAPSSLKDHNWDGVSIHDLDDDGFPEIIGRGGSVWDHTGKLLTNGPSGCILDSEPALGDLDGDGKIELVGATAGQGTIWRWNAGAWQMAYMGPSFGAQVPAFFGFADFDKDGKADIAATGNDVVYIYTLAGQVLLKVTLSAGEGGGPPTIGDFDGDGKPELASAGATAYRLFDIKCAAGGGACEAPGIKWTRPSQDATSKSTGSTIFDFEGDGAAEAVYADECFLRVYKGSTGEVLFSAYRNSCTWWEQPIIADPDNSTRTKILVNGNTNCFVMCNNPLTTEPGTGGVIDKLHPGVRCAVADDCFSKNCVAGFCRCNADTDCGKVCPGPQPGGTPDAGVYDPNCVGAQVSVGPPGGPFFTGGLVCANPIAGTPGTGKVCRTQHPNPGYDPYRSQLLNGVKVYRDKLDRWASSRNLWNQNVYSITNINDDGKVPKTSAWKQNFLDKGMNNFRANRQGATSSDLADITGALNPANTCVLNKDGTTVSFTGRICNRGLRGVASNMPATFYVGGGDGGPLGMELCRTSTMEPVPTGACKDVVCTTDKKNVPPPGSTITMIVNDAGGSSPGSNRITDECNYENNTATTTVPMCIEPPK